MEKIECYKTSDGKIFESKFEAITHQRYLNNENWYEDNKLYGNHAGSYCEYKDLVNWLLANEDKVLEILDIDI